jgi:hypothetical protein
MPAFVIWVFFVVIQAVGNAGDGYSERASCDEARKAIIEGAGKDLIAVSECVPVTLVPPTSKEATREAPQSTPQP